MTSFTNLQLTINDNSSPVKDKPHVKRCIAVRSRRWHWAYITCIINLDTGEQKVVLPDLIKAVALCTLTTHGKPYSRATTAPAWRKGQDVTINKENH